MKTWWFVQPHRPRDLRSVKVVDFQVTPDFLASGPEQGTIDVELHDKDERDWASRLNALWLMRGAGLWRMVRLVGPLAVQSCGASDQGLPERQRWCWVVVERRGRAGGSYKEHVRPASH